MVPIRSLCIVYDAACGLCTGVKAWLERQQTAVPLEFVASGSDRARKEFPRLPPGELAVVANTGEAWLGNNAWIVCLWALRDYREWSLRFSNPLLRLMAREAFAVISNHRSGISELLGLRSDAELERRLRKVSVPACLPNSN
jgi:predicted DCC family thiol-disulfide oxidoreductase YuxK